MYEIDEEQIKSWWKIFKHDNKLVEIRLLGKNTYSGYFKDVNTLISQIRPLLDHNNVQYYGSLQAYFTLNDIHEDLYSREQHDIFVKKPKSTTLDNNIVRRSFVLIDLDPNRTAGVSASDEEFEKAHLKAVKIYKFLINEGFKEPIITTSGNGYHLYLPCDMPNDDEHNELIKRFLQGLSKLFSDEYVEIDEKVFNPARIDKLIGTWAKKGSDNKERKWRISKILKVPNDLSPNDDVLFAKVAEHAPKEEPKVLNKPQRNHFNSSSFDLVTWLNEHNIEYKESKQGASTKFILKHCPWEDTHSSIKEYESALFLDTDGKITFSCFHSHCKDKTWQDFRLFYEPNAYDKPLWQPQPMYVPVQYAIQQNARKKYEIKQEIPELGEKWMSLSSVQKVDITKLEKVKTGFIDLDKRIGGMYMSEVTVLSGSNSSGKSSFLNTLLLNVIEQNYKVALWSGELRDYILKSWIYMPAAGANYLKQSQYDEGRFYVPDNVSVKIDEWLDGKLFLYNNMYGSNAKQVLNDMNILLKASVKVFILDNMMSMELTDYEGDKNDRQKAFILCLKDFAMANECHIILVAHPRKVMAFLRKNDISGTGDITNAIDNCWIMHRVNQDFIKAVTEFYDASMANRLKIFGNVLSVEKNRLFGVCDYMFGMYYDLISRRFKNTEYEDMHYGWEQLGTQSDMAFRQPSIEEEIESKMFGNSDNQVPY